MARASSRARSSSPARRSRNAVASSSLAMSAMRVYPPGMRRALIAAAVAVAVIPAAVLSLVVVDMLGWAGLWPSW